MDNILLQTRACCVHQATFTKPHSFTHIQPVSPKYAVYHLNTFSTSEDICKAFTECFEIYNVESQTGIPLLIIIYWYIGTICGPLLPPTGNMNYCISISRNVYFYILLHMAYMCRCIH